MQNNSDVLVGGGIKMVNNGEHFRHDKNAKRKRRMAIHEAVHRQFFDQVQSNLEKKQETGFDVAFAVGNLARYNHRNDKSHMKAAKQTVQYLFHTKDMALKIRGAKEGNIRLYVDASGVSMFIITLEVTVR